MRIARLSGHGFTAITEEEVVAAAVNEVIAPALHGEDPLAHERIWAPATAARCSLGSSRCCATWASRRSPAPH